LVSRPFGGNTLIVNQLRAGGKPFAAGPAERWSLGSLTGLL